jgi:hypothetical protein
LRCEIRVFSLVIPQHKLGRSRPKQNAASHPRLFASPHHFGSLPPAPLPLDFYSAGKAALSNILANNSLGDCTAAGACHAVEGVTAAAGDPTVFTADQAIAFYSLSTGYVPGNPATDQGGDEITVCSTWRDKGLDGKGAHRILGWLSVDPTNIQLVQSCQYVFEILYFGIELADPWLQVGGDGFVWDVGAPPNPNSGHCVVGLGANQTGIQIDSWGFIGTITYAAVAQFCAANNGGNLFAICTQDILDRAALKAPTGFDWDAVQQFFAQQGGAVTPPAPAPPGPDCSPSAAVKSALRWLRR